MEVFWVCVSCCMRSLPCCMRSTRCLKCAKVQTSLWSGTGQRGASPLIGYQGMLNAYMAAALQCKGCVVNICKRCRLESITWLSTRVNRGWCATHRKVSAESIFESKLCSQHNNYVLTPKNSSDLGHFIFTSRAKKVQNFSVCTVTGGP